MEAIKVDSLTKNFNGVIAVDHISFSVPVGELFGLLGPNGAGKTTTINMLSTLLKPTSGHGEVAGFDIAQDRDSVWLSIGVVFQEPALDTKLTGRENLEFHAMMYGMEKEARKERIDEVLRLVELTEKERDNLVKVLDYFIPELRGQIASGVKHDWKMAMKDEEATLKDVQQRLKQLN